jgi:hypothetical protein
MMKNGVNLYLVGVWCTSLLSLPVPSSGLEKITAGDNLKEANSINASKEVLVSSTLGMFTNLLKPKFDLLKNCGVQQKYSNVETQSCF